MNMLMDNMGFNQDHQRANAMDPHGGRSVQQEIHRFSISELQAAYARGSLQPGDVIAHFIERIEAKNRDICAFVELDHDQIAAALAASEARFASDNQRPLEGIPIAVTADFAVSGLCHHAGMAARDNMVASADCDVVQRLRDAGAIILGTLNVDEGVIGNSCSNPYVGRTANPHNLENVVGRGGSSAAAVAAGLCVAALSMDGLGASRVSASFCGVFGLMPTQQKVALHGIWPQSPRFDSVGLLGRSMDDLSFLMNVLFMPDLATAMRRSRFMRLASNGYVPCSSEVTRIVDTVMADLPQPMEDVVLGRTCSEIRQSAAALQARELIVQLVALGEERCAQISPSLASELEFALVRTESEYAADEVVIAEAVSQLRQQVASNGILVVPSAPFCAPSASQPVPDHIADLAVIANIAGLPSVSIPVARDAGGMPIGLMLIGPAGGDAMVTAQARMINDRMRGYQPPLDY